MGTEILQTIKRAIGISDADYSFDQDLIFYINSVMVVLSQMGLSEANGLIINQNTTWGEFLGDRTDLEIVKTYIGFKVRKMFDPPTSSAAIESMNQIIQEFEWRILNLDTIKKAVR